jgi:mono/diheme cytochrome c family protein
MLLGSWVWFGLALGSASRAATAQGRSVARLGSVWDGVYTLQQAKRGQERYDVFCTGCHGSDMQGDGVDVPALVDARFARKWDRRTLKDLFSVITERMPENRPGTLSKETYGDLLAYILQGNGFPNGITELSYDSNELARIVFDEVAPDPR